MTAATVSSAPTRSLLDLRPLLRADLEWSCRKSSRSTRWLARDPISLKYYWFGDREYRILRLFEGQRTLAQIQSAWEQSHALDPLDDSELRQFVLRLESQGVVQFAGAVSARKTEERLGRIRRRRWFSIASSPLAIRLPLFDPTPLLNQLDWVRHLFFRPAFLVVSLVLAFLIGVLSVAVMSTQWIDRNLLEQLLVGDGIWYLLIAFVLLKSLHELGHALVCRHFGGECHEIGILLLVFVPCMYCDVSDAWKLKSSFARIMISAAGILVELFFAALAAIVWLSTQPSLINSAAFSIMLVGSLGTVFVNGNPLLRYDGYYILSDFVGIPNLAQQSQEALHSTFRRWFFRNQFDSTHWDASGNWLRLYGVAAWAYRLLLLVAIFLGLYHWFSSLGLQWVLLPLFAGILIAIYARVRQISLLMLRESHHMRPLVTISAIAVIGCAAYVFCFVPLPSRIDCRGMVLRTPREAVYAPVDSVLIDSLPSSHRFASGATLLQLESLDLRLEQLILSGEVESLRQRVDDLAARQVDDPDAASQLATARQSLLKLQPQLDELNGRMDELSVRAPRSGIVLTGDREPVRLLSVRPVARRTGRNSVERGLNREYQGAVFSRGTRLALIASEDQWNAEVLVDESLLRWVHVGATTRLRLDRAMDAIIHGTVEEISDRPISDTPEQLQLDTLFQSIAEPDGTRQPATPHFSVTIRVESTETCPSHGAVLSARIETQPRILAVRFYESVLRLLRNH